MNIVMTGHTSGLGENLFKLFSQEHKIIGFSRPEYDLTCINDQKKLIEKATKADLFINNTFLFDNQLNFVKKLQGKTKIVTIGSIASKFSKNVEWNIYGKYKKDLEDYHRLESAKGHDNIVLINITSQTIESNINSLVAFINFWIDNPCITFIEFANNVN